MPFQRGNPKPPGSGRIKGIPNKRTLAAAAMAVGASNAYDPAYDDLKRMAVQFKEWIAEEKKRKSPRMGRLITLHDRLARISREYLLRATARYAPGTSSPMADRSMLSSRACKAPGGQNELRPRDPQTHLANCELF
jgi:hypothetical protein